MWDGYGQQRSDQWSPARSDTQYTADDPVGFEGQAGYYQDWELAQEQTLGSNQTNWVFLTSTPSLLTHRYYDAGKGRFVNRDPIGYGGGANLYGFCGNNPVTNSDPLGLDANGNGRDPIPAPKRPTIVRPKGYILSTFEMGMLAYAMSLGGDDAPSIQPTPDEEPATGETPAEVNEEFAEESAIVEELVAGGEVAQVVRGGGGVDLAIVARNYRFETGLQVTGGPNISVFEHEVTINGQKSLESTVFESGTYNGVYMHAEERGIAYFTSQGTLGSVKRVYTELHPCGPDKRDCLGKLRTALPGVPVYFSRPYGNLGR